ncbi:MAG TPA: PxKF domain-containing protein, partial [Anaerolineales bacterium]|nr:PxKF domain-containing protein [Anaerolineales bacterium]
TVNVPPPPSPAVFFNEIHYDNTGGDVGEAIEIAGPTCTDLTGWSVVLYNGTGGAVYNTTTLSGPIPNMGGGFGVVVVNYPSNGIQNGSPDGMALVDNANNVIQFLSYEGTFTAVGGPANGLVSTDIGVSEPGTGAIGTSLRLSGSGSTYNNFTWASAATSSFGAFNQGQTFTGGGSTPPCGTGAANPSTVFAGDNTLLTVSVISGTNPASTGLAVTADLSQIGGSASQVFYDDGSNGDLTAADNIFSYLATVSGATSPGILTLPATITDPEARSGSASISLTVQPPLSAIHDIQGTSHISPLANQLVSTQGVVTVKASNGFYMEEPSANWDANDSTSEGVFVFTSSATSVNVGNSVLVTGTVKEFRPGGVSNGNLTTTEINDPGLSVTVQSTGNPLPTVVVIGTSGRMPPTENIEDDATGDVENSGVFDPAMDGIDFYESMEGMLVQVNDPVAVGPTNAFGETPVVPDNGTWAGVRTARGGILLRPNDGNPERLVLDDVFVAIPAMNVGDQLNGGVVGALDYNFGNFFLEVTSNPLPPLVSGGLTQEVTTPAGTNQLAVATFNVENLAPSDPPSKYATLAELIVNHLQAPDVIAIEEIQDNSGATDDGTVDASTTWSLLISAISTAGGPTYDYRQIDPVNDADGGQPGGNIRQGFLFRTDRGLSFIDRPGGGSTTANAVVGSGTGTQLQYSPGRIDPTNSAFSTSRKPLAGEFTFRGHHLFVIANHFNSKGGDDPLFGHFQPPTRISETQRHQQAQVEHDFINGIITADPNADVVVMGDLNDFEFSDTVTILKGTPTILNDLMDTLSQNERYSYVFEGNSQTLDHTLLSNDLFSTRPFAYDVVHVNSEFADQASDHEPQVTRITLNDAPTVDAGGPYSVIEGNSVTVSATGSDFEDDLANIPLTYAWDLDNNGSFETPGQSATFSAPANSAPATYTIKVQVTDSGGFTAVDSATVNVIYNFNGFFQPVDNLPTFNVVKAGSGIPVKFSLSGDQGLSIFTAGYPKSEMIACSSTDPVDGIEETVTAGSSGLSYDALTDTYTYTWKTDKAWANSCRQLVVKLNDGTLHRANFKFTK